jgi:hypothetical protein
MENARSQTAPTVKHCLFEPYGSDSTRILSDPLQIGNSKVASSEILPDDAISSLRFTMVK